MAFLLFGLMSGTLFVGALVAALLVAFTLQAHHRKLMFMRPEEGGRERFMLVVGDLARPGQNLFFRAGRFERRGRPNPAESKPRRLPGLDERTVGIEFADLRLKDHSILVAGGSSKINAIFDALRQLREYFGNKSDYGESLVGKLDLQKILNI